MEAKNQQAKRWLVPALLVVIILLLAALLFMRSCQAETTEITDDETPRIGYAEGVTVVDDQDALQKAVDEMYAQAAEEGIPLSFKNDASSTDGENFDCYIANPASSHYDMYIQIFADDAFTDQLFLSGLLRPGTAFETIKLDHALETGTHRVIVALTQVEEDLATIHAQAMVTMDFTVTE